MKFTKAERAKEILGFDRDEVDTGGKQRWVRDAIPRVHTLQLLLELFCIYTLASPLSLDGVLRDLNASLRAHA